MIVMFDRSLCVCRAYVNNQYRLLPSLHQEVLQEVLHRNWNITIAWEIFAEVIHGRLTVIINR